MKSIGTKLALQIAVVLTVTMTISGAFDVYQRHKKFTDLLHAKQDRTQQQLALLFGELLFGANDTQIENVMKSYLTDPDILSIKILENEDIVRYIGKDPDTMKLDEFTEDVVPAMYSDAVLHKVEIAYAGEILGTTEIIFSQQFIRELMQDTIVKVSWNTFLVILIESLVVLTLVRRNISVVLLNLAQAARRIANGDVDVRLPRVAARDEIGSLIIAFETMVGYVQGLANAATGISLGELRYTVSPRSEKDILGYAFANMSAYLNQITVAATAIASGDLRGDFQPKSEHDILGNAFQQMKSLRQSISEITMGSRQLRTASDELTQISSLMASATEQSSQRAQFVSLSSQQISENVDAVAISMEQFSANIREISQNTIEVVHIAINAVELAKKANLTIADLETRSQEIGDIINIITAVTQQTNLLALNATIESARAGEAGKGFAVVAHEIKELSRETATSTSNIVRKLEAIWSSSKDARAAIDDVLKIILQIRDLSDSIAIAIEQQSVTTQEIVMRMNEAARGSQDITHVTADVATATKETSAGAEAVRRAAGDLASLADRFQQLVSRFKI